VDKRDWRNYPSPWWVLWVQRGVIAAVGVWGVVIHAWLTVAVAVVFVALHIWVVHRSRVERAARDAHFAEVLRSLEDGR